MITGGVGHFVEIGPGNVSSGIINIIDKDVSVESTNTKSLFCYSTDRYVNLEL